MKQYTCTYNEKIEMKIQRENWNENNFLNPSEVLLRGFSLFIKIGPFLRIQCGNLGSPEVLIKKARQITMQWCCVRNSSYNGDTCSCRRVGITPVELTHYISVSDQAHVLSSKESTITLGSTNRWLVLPYSIAYNVIVNCKL